MLIRVDHFSYIIKKNQEQEVLKQLEAKGYQEFFQEIRKANLDIKKEYMKYKSEYHNIFYMQTKTQCPIEVISYEETESQRTPLGLIGQSMFLW